MTDRQDDQRHVPLDDPRDGPRAGSPGGSRAGGAAPVGAPAEADAVAPPPGRLGMPAGRVLTAMVACLLAWTLLFSPELVRSAEAQPTGARRSIALSILRPLAWVSDAVGLSSVTDAAMRGLGRDPDAPIGGDPTFPTDDLPTIAPTPRPSGGPTAEPSPDPKPPTVDSAIRVPTGADRLRVTVVGDSLAAGVGFFAGRVFKPFFVDVKRYGKISTGLARPDYFNWPRAMQQIAVAYRPDLVVVMLGENDNQALRAPNGAVETQIGTGAWPPAYEQRVERFAKIATRSGAHVVWVGLPVERDEARWTFIQRQNAIYEEVADRLPNVAYLDTWALFDDPNGGYTAYYRDDDHVELVREADGVHFTATGYTIMVEKLAELAHERFDLHPKTYAG